MKRIFLPLLAVVLALPAYAQQEADMPDGTAGKRRHIIKLVPQEFVVNTFRIDWEAKTGKRSSLQLSPSFTSAQNSVDFEKISGGGAELTAKFYLRSEGELLKGFYGGLNAGFHKFKINDTFSRSGPGANFATNHNVSRLAGNLVLGYQFIFDDIVALDVYAGGGIRASRLKETIDPYVTFSFPDPRYQGIAPKVGFSVGIIL